MKGLTSYCLVFVVAALICALVGGCRDVRIDEETSSQTTASLDVDVVQSPAAEETVSQAVDRADQSSQNRVNIRGRFVYPGVAPPPKIIQTQLAFCGKEKMQDESLIVDPYTRGIANVCVWLESDTVAPAARSDDGVVLLNENCQFVPHITCLQVGQQLTIKNADPVGHILKIDGFRNEPVVANLPVKNSVSTSFNAVERVPSIVTSSVYPWMRGYIIVKSHGYVAVSGRDGSFEIRDLPAGTLKFQVWHEKTGYVRHVEVDDAAIEWPRGQLEMTIDTDTELGDIIVAPELFQTIAPD